jgi:hypothetical protein
MSRASAGDMNVTSSYLSEYVVRVEFFQVIL